MAKSQRSAKEPSYGEASARLDEILQQLEDGDVDIDEVSTLVTEAGKLVKVCRSKIQATKIQVRQIEADLNRPIADAIHDENDSS